MTSQLAEAFLVKLTLAVGGTGRSLVTIPDLLRTIIQ
jgi:hypothetical protein